MHCHAMRVSWRTMEETIVYTVAHHVVARMITHAMAHHGAQWRTMLYAHRGDPWCTMVCCGMPWCAMTFYVASWCAGWTGKLYSLYARHITENESIEVTLTPHAFNANNNKTPETPQLLSLTAC